MLLFSKVERLTQRMAGMAFLGNFQDNLCRCSRRYGSP